MRHLWSLLVGIIAAPLTWLLLATGQHRWQATVHGWYAADTFDTAALVGPAVVILVAGVLLGVLGTMRWSPAGPIGAGILLALPTVIMFGDPFRLRLADHWRVLGQDFAPRLPIENGTMLLLGVLLLMAAFSLQRWRRWPSTVAPLPPATDAEVVAGIDNLTADDPHQDQAAAPWRQPMTDDDILAEARSLDSQPTVAHPPEEPPAHRPGNSTA